jgi:hypothetical protein
MILKLYKENLSGCYSTVIASGVLLGIYVLASVAVKYFEERRIIPIQRGKEKYKTTVRSFSSFFNSVLPPEYNYESIIALFRKKFTQEHDLLCLLDFSLNNSKKATWSEKWLMVFSKFLNGLAVNVLLALILYPSNTPCGAIEHKLKCINGGMPVKKIAAVCSWNEKYQVCEPGSINSTIFHTIYLVFIATICVSMLDKIMRFMTVHALLAVEQRRMEWIYGCFFLNSKYDGTNDTGFSSIIKTSFSRLWPSTNKVTPSLNTASTSCNGSSSSLPVASRKWNMTLVGQRVRSDQRMEDGRLKEALDMEESKAEMEHFGDEWLDPTVQLRKST